MNRILVGSFVLSVAALPHAAQAQAFTVHRADDKSVVHTGELSAEVTDAPTKVVVKHADFSEFTTPGEYYLEIEGKRSVTFRIAPDVYDGELANVMLGFYGWRSGIDIAFEHNGIQFGHAKGHLADGLLDYAEPALKGMTKDGTGGWYDAGDYGKYLPTAGMSVNNMLAAWDMNGERLSKLVLPFIPETGGTLPDYLDELKFELLWVLKMQAEDGRVYHKLNSPNFPGLDVAPAEDTSARYFAGYSTAATGEFVATTAKSARTFETLDPEFAARLRAAAELSYAYLRAHPDDLVEYDMSVLKAGEYGKKGADDLLWAAAEMFELTGSAESLADFESRIKANTAFVPNFDWGNTSNFGLLSYVLSKREGRNPALVEQLTKSLLKVSNDIVTTAQKSGYGRGYDGYYWGSNGVIVRMCMILHGANAVEPNPAFLDACTDQISNVYGRNQYNRSHVTGSGIKPVMFPHHRPTVADKIEAPYPGLLVGGGTGPTRWMDAEADFTSNEVAINWNAALAAALASFYSGESAPSLGRGPVDPADCEVRVSSVGYLPDRAKVATFQPECELPSSFKCMEKEDTLSGDNGGPLHMIDDFEDGDLDTLKRSGRQGKWAAFDDKSGGDRTEPEIEDADRDGSKSALCMSGGGFTMWGGGLGVSLSQSGSTRKFYDAANYTGVSFWAKGSGDLRVMVVDQYSDPAGEICSGCNDHFFFPVTLTEDWTEYVFTWEELKQSGFGDLQPRTCSAALYALNFQWGSKTDFEFCLDDVGFTTPKGTAEESTAGGSGKSDDDGKGAIRVSDGGCSAASPGGARGALALMPLLGLALLVVRRTRRRKQAD